MNFWQRLKSVFVGLDNAAAAVAFDGQTDITISSRCGMALIDDMRGLPRTAESRMLHALGDSLDEIQAGHCVAAVLGDAARAQRVLDLLGPYVEFINAKEITHASN